MAYTATNWVEGVTTLGPTNLNKIETELALLDKAAGVGSLSSTPPGSPVDGQLWYQGVATGGAVWAFRYNAGSSSAYKWEFVGGPPSLLQAGTTYVLGAGATMVADSQLATFGGLRAGDYVWSCIARISSSASPASFTYNYGPMVNGVAAFTPPITGWASTIQEAAAEFPLNATPASAAIALGHNTNSTANVTALSRSHAIIPVRVS